MTNLIVEDFDVMLGKTIESIDGKVGDDVMDFFAEDGTIFKFIYYPDCCASCNIIDIIGDLSDLLNSPILEAQQITSENYKNKGDYQPSDSYTWSFYRFSTVQGTVTVRWLGESNGYYSESVDFKVIKPKHPIAPKAKESKLKYA